jgi:hypothetical protein
VNRHDPCRFSLRFSCASTISTNIRNRKIPLRLHFSHRDSCNASAKAVILASAYQMKTLTHLSSKPIKFVGQNPSIRRVDSTSTNVQPKLCVTRSACIVHWLIDSCARDLVSKNWIAFLTTIDALLSSTRMNLKALDAVAPQWLKRACH